MAREVDVWRHEGERKRVKIEGKRGGGKSSRFPYTIFLERLRERGRYKKRTR
jgi:hypothetical protein